MDSKDVASSRRRLTASRRPSVLQWAAAERSFLEVAAKFEERGQPEPAERFRELADRARWRAERLKARIKAELTRPDQPGGPGR